MKLYHFPPSPNSRVVIALAYHLGISLELETVNLFKGQQMHSEFVKLNPNHMIPTLIDGDFVLWESTAIMQYLAATHPGNTLWPIDVRVQADINRWMSWRLAHWGAACGIFIFERLVKPNIGLGDADSAEIAKGEERFHRFAKVLNDHLRGRLWLVNDYLTLADFSVGGPLDLRDVAGYPLGSYREITRWYTQLEALPAWQRSAPKNLRQGM